MLDLGDLVGRVMLKDDQFNSVLDMLPEKIRSSGAVSKIAALGLGALIAGSLVSGIDTAMDMEVATDKVQASLGLTEQQAAIAGAAAGKLYSDAYGESIEDVNGAVGTVISSFDGMRNASESDIESVTAKLFNLQTAMGIDVARSAQVAGQAVKNGLAGDANEAIDLLVANMQRVPANLREDLLDAIDEYGPILHNMGYSGAEAFGLLADAADKGMYGIDKTGDALKELSIRSTDMSTASVAAYTAAGLNAEEMSAKFAAGGESARGATEQLIDALLGMSDPVAQSNAAIALFGTPLEDLGTQEIPTFLDNLQQVQDGFKDTAGAADEMGAVVNGNAKTGWVELNRSWETLLGTVGGFLIPIIQTLTQVMNENPAVLQAVAVALGILAIAFAGVTVATWAMNTALLANPIVWIIVGIMALIGAIILLVMNWDTVVGFLGDAWAGFIGWFTGVMDGFLGWWGGVWDGFMGFLGDAWDNAVSLVQGALGFLMDMFYTWNPIGIIIANWDAIVAFFASIPQTIMDLLAGFGGMLIDWWNGTLQAFATVIAIGIMAVIYLFTQFPTDVMNALSGFGEWLVQTGVDLLLGLGAGIVAGWEAVVAWFNALPGVIASFLVTVGTWLLQTGMDLLTGMQTGIVNGWAAVSAWFLSLPGVVWAFFVSVGTWILLAGIQLIDGLRAGLLNGWNAVVAWFNAMPGVVMGFLAAAGSWLVSSGSSLISGLLNGAVSMWGNFMAFLGGIPGAITGFFTGMGSWLYSAGQDLINGLMDGIGSLAGTIGSFFLNLLPGWIVGPFKAALGIASPSKVFMGFGENIGEGIMVGLDRVQGDLDARVAGMVSVPPVDVALRAGSAASGAYSAAGAASSAVSVDARQEFHGDIHVTDLDELQRQQDTRQRDAMALAGVTTLEG